MENLSEILYLVAAVCFIMAIKGLASPKSARTGNTLGIIGMVIAIAVTLWDFKFESQQYIIGIILIGGAIGAAIALLREFPYLGHETAVSGARIIIATGLPYLIVYGLKDNDIILLGVFHAAQDKKP